MAPGDLIVHCYAERKEDQWQAICLELTLAAQGESFQEAKEKLESQICEYVYDALVGEDRPHGSMLLSRRAPFWFWLKYYVYWLLTQVGGFKDGMIRLFESVLPMTPMKPTHA